MQRKIYEKLSLQDILCHDQVIYFGKNLLSLFRFTMEFHSTLFFLSPRTTNSQNNYSKSIHLQKWSSSVRLFNESTNRFRTFVEKGVKDHLIIKINTKFYPENKKILIKYPTYVNRDRKERIRPQEKHKDLVITEYIQRLWNPGSAYTHNIYFVWFFSLGT